ncbi:piggyBac transposable element-derived protein 3-like isoform X1 [Dendronephthya gigantea]|uniref:piggyBac transposable element-derived protein 3-like isoform X1 n=1 Tax=Dendronephthya gigantea TaxID=151771 RepID=UPI00106999A1|nr:piggyBac transposable element-derived protein 3-like isoform X1 [Dendronephthya gigantea]
MILEQTQIYATSQSINNSSANEVNEIKVEDIQKAFGIILYMGILKLPNRRMYWQHNTRVDIIANTMGVNRFAKIMQLLHYNDNNLIPASNSEDYNKCYKIQPLVDYIRNKFFEVVVPETYVAVDEQVVPFKGASGLKRYLPKKPKKWGYKLWALAGVSGYVYTFEIDGEKGKTGPPSGWDAPEKCGESGFVVLRLIQRLEANKHKLFFDNFFSCPELIAYLGTKGFWALATLNCNRSRKCPLPSESQLKKSGRGSSEQNVNKERSVVVTSWYDSKRVLMISNFIGRDPVGECTRYVRKEKANVNVKRPASVQLYNNYMGGVDKSDMMLALYRTKYRCRKWYQRIALHMISQCAVNAWIIYKEIGGTKSYLDFLTEVCVTLMVGKPRSEESDEDLPEPPPSPKKRMRASSIPESVRFDKYDHWPILMDIPNAQRCKMDGCKKKTMFMCSKCNVYLCVTKNTCFLNFHGK